MKLFLTYPLHKRPGDSWHHTLDRSLLKEPVSNSFCRIKSGGARRAREERPVTPEYSELNATVF